MEHIREIKISKPPLLDGAMPEDKREELLNYFHKTYDLYEKLFEIIIDEKSYYTRPEPLRHPLIFYYGHTATFYINKMILAKYINTRINPNFESMFAIGVDEMSWDDLDESNYQWPALNEVRAYRQEVRKTVDHFIRNMPLSLPINQDDPAWLILMGIEHERIHIETSSVIIRMLPIEEVQPTGNFWQACTSYGKAPDNCLVPVNGGEISLAKPNTDMTYGWDNEYGNSIETVESFSAAKYLTSNQEYLTFVEAGGYENPKFWTEEGKRWLSATGTKLPRFWLKKDGKYLQRNLLEIIELPLNWPVEVNYYEAKAFCNWKTIQTGKNIRLPKEAEWMLLRNMIQEDLPYWEKAPGNINLEYFASSCPIDMFETNGFYDIIGNVWQWSETPIDGFEGFKVHKLYDDFSTPTFDGRHILFKGGSWISTGNEALKSSRYAFRKHFYQHAGFRYIEATPLEQSLDHKAKENIYETDESLSQYLEFHYGHEYFSTKNFPKACVDACIEAVPKLSRKKALDLGCAVGRSSFELAKHFEHVIALDFSARFINEAVHLQNGETIAYNIKTEGNLFERRTISLKDFTTQQNAKKIEFLQGDACNLKPIYSGFDLIFAGNLIDRLYNPSLFLETIHKRLCPGGFLAITSPYTWLEEYTEIENWIGGKKIADQELNSFDGLSQILNKHFNLVKHEDIPFILRETKRKFQHTIADFSLWELK
ncbi:MAG: 5-histidylcysteine sulfoxide synthase [Bdellovibrionota bacterium]